MLMVALFVAEMWAVLTGHSGGTISNVVWTIEGPRFGLRWFLVWFTLAGLMGWTIWHFAMESPGWKQLLALMGGCAFTGVLLWLSYR